LASFGKVLDISSIPKKEFQMAITYKLYNPNGFVIETTFDSTSNSLWNVTIDFKNPPARVDGPYGCYAIKK